MIVALYTSRKILETLGVDDFGIFNVVGGIISLMSFINGSMSVATQRYLTYELGRGTEGQFNKVFNMAVYIHAIIAVIVLIAAETVGVWFVNTQLNIPEVRMEAANWVFQATILTTILGILQTPYNAAIISHEHMHVYAYVGLGETFAKLFIVWGLFYYPYDRLAIWGFAIFLLQFLIAMTYRMYCSRQFPECRLHLRWNKAIFNSMVQFTGWNMFGTIAWLLKDQGVNILMNLFGGPVANAARGVSCQVSGAIQNLTGGFQSAVNPQLTKRYAAHESEETCDLMCKSSKISYFLLFTIALPVMMETDFILDLWLVEVPPMTASFTRIIIIEALLNAFGGPMITSLMATGNIKWYQIVVSSSLLFIIPVAYLLLKSGYSIETPLIVSVIHNDWEYCQAYVLQETAWSRIQAIYLERSLSYCGRKCFSHYFSVRHSCLYDRGLEQASDYHFRIMHSYGNFDLYHWSDSIRTYIHYILCDTQSKKVFPYRLIV